ncbi:MAG: ATP-binding protein [Arcobacteraceae bacterium]|nr:ATP-binding protein [Arcobacteraceae bacterium]
MKTLYNIRHFVLAPFILLITILVCVILYNDKQSRINLYLNQQSSLALSQYKSVYNSYEMVAQSIFILIGSSELVKDIYRKTYSTDDLLLQDIYRQELYTLLNPRYLRFKELGLEQLHFHTRTNHSFLRFHKPDWHGDDLSEIRYSISFVNQYKHFISGFELGRVVHGFRYVFPITDNNGIHLGSVETSISSDYFIQAIKKSFDSIAVSFIVDKNMTNDHLFEESNLLYQPSYESTDYLSMRTNIIEKESELKELFSAKISDDINTKISQRELFSIYNKVKGNSILATFIPIRELHENKVAAYIVSYKQSSYLDELSNDFIKLIAFAIIGLIGFYILIAKLIVSMYKISTQKDDEIEQEKILRQRDNLLYQQSKMASLGEMISNIAHQWRQPLNAISTAASGMKLQSELDILEKDTIIKTTDNIVNYTQYLSKIIDEFRNFIKQDQSKINTTIESILRKSLLLISSKIKNSNIEIINNNSLETTIYIFENELIQSILKITQNAIEALSKDTHKDDKLIIISTYIDENNLYISIQDSAHGIKEEHIEKIFDPYFTTKHQSQGVGLGLYVTYQIITTQLNGHIKVVNKTFTYNGKEHFGAEFVISLPIN